VLEHNTNLTSNRGIRLSEASVDSTVGKRRRQDSDMDMGNNADGVFKIPQVNSTTNLNYSLQANNRRTFSSILKENTENGSKIAMERKKSTNKTKMIIGKGSSTDNGLSVASRNHHFYVGNLHIDTTTNAVETYINKFAKVEKIFQLKTKHRYYKSFYVEVNEIYNEKINDAGNWPSNVRIKRFFHSKHSKLEEHILNENNEKQMDTNVTANLITTQ
jgi:ribosomal protein L31